MFAYCLNNPVTHADAGGNLPSGIINPNAMTHNGGSIRPISDKERRERELRKQAKKLFNTSEEAVLYAERFAFYKGVPVFRTNGNRCGSFGAIFITKGTNLIDNPEDMIRHEYGHTVQMCQLGIRKYLTCIFIPSWQEWGSDAYYNKPWEVTADIYGGVVSRNPTPAIIAAGYSYLANSVLGGISVWVTID